MKKIFKSLMAVVLMTSVMSLTGCGSKEVSPMEFLTADYDGIDGRGTLQVNFDEEGFKDAIVEAAPEKKQKDLKSDLQLIDFDSIVTVNTDKTENLSNGDKVTISITYDDSFLKDYKVKFSGDTKKKITIEGLKEAIILDAFDPKVFNVKEDEKGVHIKVTGTSPKLKVSIQNDMSGDDPRSVLYYSLDDTEYYANGDELKVYVEIPYSIDGETYVPKEDETSILLEGYAGFITKPEELTDDNLESIKNMSLNELQEQLDREGFGSLEFDDYRINNKESDRIEYSWGKAYLFTIKDGVSTNSTFGTYNQLLITLSVSVKGAEKEGFNEDHDFVKTKKDFSELGVGLYCRNISTSSENGVTVKDDDMYLLAHVYPSVGELTNDLVGQFKDMFDITVIDVSSWNK